LSSFCSKFCLFTLFLTGISALAAPKQADLLHQLPLTFEENCGQWDKKVLFTSQGRGAKLFVTEEGVTFAIGTGAERAALRFSVVGASADGRVSGEREFGGAANYLKGNDPANWVTGARRFGAVRSSEVKPGIDLVYYGHGQELEYDVVLRPGAKAAELRFRFEGADKLSVNGAGDLLVKTAAGELVQHRPAVWQEVAGKRTEISAAYRLVGKNSVAINVGKYDERRELVIDPVLSFATYLGGKADDAAYAVALDSSGNVYIGGYTQSTDFPTSIGAYRVALNGQSTDVFVTKLNPTGTAILYSTLIGGSGNESALGLVVDSGGNAYMTGTTSSYDFPTTAGSLSPLRNNASIFVTKLNAAGTGLVYSTYLGAGYNDFAGGIAIDSAGNAYVVGSTYGSFPVTTGAFSTDITHGVPNSYGTDAFVAKLNSTGSALVYATYLGGTGYETATGVTLDLSGQAYITGNTTSADFPTSATSFQKTYPFTGYGYYASGSGYVVCLNSAGAALTYSTYLGGSNGTDPKAIALDAGQNAYVVGQTGSTDFPTTPGSFSASLANPGHGFLSKLNYVGTALVYSTFLGGSGTETINNVAVDSAGSALVTGITNSTNFPITPGSFPLSPTADYPNTGLFLTKFNPGGSSVLYSTFFGPSGQSNVRSLALDNSGNPVMAGNTTSKTMATPVGSLQRTNTDPGTQFGSAFVNKIDLSSGTMCSLSLSTVTLAVPLSGATGMVTVTTPNGCPWEATVSNPYYNTNFVTLGNSAGVGNGSFTYTVPSNNATTTTRATTIHVGPASVAVTQPAGSCNQPLLGPTSYGFDLTGGLSSISVQLPSGCIYTPVASAPWIQLSSTSALNGSATVYYFITRNDYGTRFGYINIGGTLFNISQTGGNCVGNLTPASAAFGAQGGTGAIPFTVAPNSCQWTAFPLVPWITMGVASGSGSGLDGFVVSPNPGSAARAGQILIAGQLFTVSQAGGGTAAPTSYTVDTVAGVGYPYGALGDGGQAKMGSLAYPRSVLFDRNGNLFIVDSGNYRVRKVDAAGIITTIAGNGIGNTDSGDGGLAVNASFIAPNLLAMDSAGNLIESGYSARIRSISAGGIISTIAGNGTPGNPPDASLASNPIPVPGGMAADGSGNLFLSDGSSRVRRLTAGALYYYAGTGVSGNNGDGLSPTATQLTAPTPLATDSAGNLLIGETSRIRKIQGGVAVTVAGGGSGPDGENIIATSISINPNAIAVDPQGNVLYTDGNRVRRVTSDGKVATIAGGTTFGSYSGDGGPALAAAFYNPLSLALDKNGNVAVADYGNSRVRLLTPVYTPCNYSLSGNNLQVSGTSGSTNITVTTTSTCAWNGMSYAPWITVSSSGTGTGTATLSYTANGLTARTGNVYIGGQLVTVSQAAGTGVVTPNPSKVGVLQTANGTWALDSNGSGVFDAGDRSFSFLADPGDIAVVGDWTGDGKSKVGVYRNGFWILDMNNNGVWDGPNVDRFIGLGGVAGDVPVVGDWNGDGRTKVGIYRHGFWILDTNGNGVYDVGDQLIGFGGNAGEQPVVGDWNGDGRTKVGYLYNGTWVLDYNGNGVYDFADKIYSFPYAAGDRAVVGDWNGSHTTKIGVFRGGFWILDYNGNGVWDGVSGGDRFSGFGGNAGEIPIVGDWNGDGKTKIGIYVRGFWVLDYNGNGQYDGTGAGQDRFIALGGVAGEQPIVGAW